MPETSITPNFKGLKSHILYRLEHELPKNLLFHPVNHTIEVLDSARELAKREGVVGDGLMLVETGAVMHDTGFLIKYEPNEREGAQITEETLPSFGYSPNYIDIECKMVLSTALPRNPQTLLEKILCDADLANLGRDDFYIKTELYRKELANYEMVFAPKAWYERTLKFLETHRYYTKSAQALWEEGKQQHIKEIKELLGINQRISGETCT